MIVQLHAHDSHMAMISAHFESKTATGSWSPAEGGKQNR